MTNSTNLLITGLEFTVVIALVVWRQLATRRVREGSRVPLILGGAGLIVVGQYATAHSLTPALLASLGVGLSFSALLAFPRAFSLRLWRDEAGRLMRRGTWVTAAWWIAVIVLRFALSAVVSRMLGTPTPDSAAFSSVSILLGLAVTLGVQQALILRRASRLAPTPVPIVV